MKFLPGIVLFAGIFFYKINLLHAQSIGTIEADGISKIRQNSADTIFVINFWATWCKPCVHEMPLFDSLYDEYKNQKVRIILISNDMKKDHEVRLNEFIIAHHIKAEVLWMNEVNANKWISLVNSNWSGAIPATWIFSRKHHLDFFKEGEITLAEIKKKIDQPLKIK